MQPVSIPVPEPVSTKDPVAQAKYMQWLTARLYATIAEYKSKHNSLIEWINDE